MYFDGGLPLNYSGTQQPSNFIIYNTVGQVIMQGMIKATETNIDISSEANGIYVVHVISTNSVGTFKIVKQ